MENDGLTCWQSELDLIAWVNGIEFQFETSSDLIDWTPLETDFSIADDGQRTKVELKSQTLVSSKNAHYVRIKLRYSPNQF